MLVRDFLKNVSGNLASAAEDDPLIIERYTTPYRAVVPYEQWQRAIEALREKEAREAVA